MKPPRLDGRQIRELETKVEQAIQQAFQNVDSRQLPAPDESLTHCMAKAAVCVYEAATQHDRKTSG